MAPEKDTHEEVAKALPVCLGFDFNGTLSVSNAMSVLTTSTALSPWNLSRYREVAPFLPNQSMKPMAPTRYFATLLATNAAHGLSLSR